MPVPTSTTELQHFVGFITYLSRFVKTFSAKSAVLRDLLRQDSDMWEAHHQQAFFDLKKEVSDNSLLHYYDPCKPTYLQCDASMRGIGAALLQPDADGELSLSRLPSPDNVTTIDLDLRVDLVRFSTERLDKVRRDTSLDTALNQLVETIISGWPEDVNDLPPDIRSF